MNNTSPFDQASHSLSPKIYKMLSELDEFTKTHTQEIRLRVGCKITLRINGELKTLEHLRSTTSDDIKETFESICGYSVYAHQNSIAQGYVTVQGGHRAGICGTAVITGGKVTMLRDITAINLRIAREFSGCASALFSEIDYTSPFGILIAGAPMSGKTTLLRDTASALAMGLTGKRYAVSLIDERGELAAVLEGVPQYKSVMCCDVLNGYPKGEAIALAVRSMAPEIIVCDEIGTEAEVESIKESLNTGVNVIAGIHAGSKAEIFSRPIIRKLIETGAFRCAVLLSKSPLKIEEIINAEDIKNEAHCVCFDNACISVDRERTSLGYKKQMRIA